MSSFISKLVDYQYTDFTPTRAKSTVIPFVHGYGIKELEPRFQNPEYHKEMAQQKER